MKIFVSEMTSWLCFRYFTRRSKYRAERYQKKLFE